ncbi:MAG TPA: hypothetical protein VF756_26555 [Thermoanaerobaculia bacterium]
MSRTLRSVVVLWCAVLCLSGNALFALDSATAVVPVPVSGTFPLAGIDQIDHDLQIDLFQRGAEGAPDTLLETLSFRGRMTIERGDPYISSSGFREVSFVVTRWEATAWSNALGSMVVYRLSPGAQPPSYITAETRTSDYPATFDFNLYFDATAYGMILIERHHGRPKGHGFMEVPPSGNRPTSPTITSFEPYVIEGEHPQYGTIYFRPRNCNDSGSQTLHTYTAAEKASLKLPQGR